MLTQLRNFRPGTGSKLKAPSRHQHIASINSAWQYLPTTAVVIGFVKAKLIERPLIDAQTDNVLPEPQWEEFFRLVREFNVKHDALARHPVIDPPNTSQPSGLPPLPSKSQFESVVALVGQASTTMDAKTRKNTQEPATEDGAVRSTLEAQLAELRAELATLPTSRQVQPARPAKIKPRVPSGLPNFKGKRGEDVRQWVLQLETLFRIHGHDGDDGNSTLPAIRTAMEGPASGWFLF
ncbi:unnamed protein product [Phytophthora fragariaefolia]|uniref:Unnamed protein product n=1 Tax=Phytophthora fragariaefolia TaxID=1490495 RepID=A0A9W6XKS0_9STRA|nr:unnamed protein product [Phytophthora fragariaefolia]